MMISLLMLVLLSAEPGAPAPAPSVNALVVATTPAPGLEKSVGEAGRALGLQLAAPYVDWSGYLKSRGTRCEQDTRCLRAAPGMAGAQRLLLVRVRPLAPGRLSVDVRLIELRTWKVLGRSASVFEAEEWTSGLEALTTRLLTRANPDVSRSAPSPFAVQPSEG